jgi:uncharacterized caspase-like protein
MPFFVKIKIMITGFILVTGLLSFFSPDLSQSEANRVALVIGNSDYKNSPLENPVNDAEDMAAVLKKCRFEVIKATDAKRVQMRRAIRAFGKKINSGAIGLFYYAGHGIQVDGENFLVPIGAEIYSEDEVEDGCLKVSSVLRKMETAGNELNIIILDACRDNPFGRSFRSSQKGLAKMDAPRGSILAYATSPGAVAADGDGRNGLYTSKLLKYIMTPNLELEKLFKRVRVDVMTATEGRQVPWESSSLTGDFYFISPEKTVAKKQVKELLQKSLIEQETLYWESIKDSTDIASFESYLDKFPNGTFAVLARLKIDKLKKKEKTREPEIKTEKIVSKPNQTKPEAIVASEKKKDSEELEKHKEIAQNPIADEKKIVEKKPLAVIHPQKGKTLKKELETHKLHKVAIFPWHINFKLWVDTGYAFTDKLSKKTAKLLSKSKNLKLEHSFYKSQYIKKTNPSVIFIKDRIDKNDINNFWLIEDTGLIKAPNLNMVLVYGKKLGADLAIMNNLRNLPPHGMPSVWRAEITTSLIDIKTRKVYRKNASVVIRLGETDFSPVLKSTTALVDAYLNDFSKQAGSN